MSDTKKWYVLRVISGKEHKLKSQIENEISRYGLQDYVGEILIPTEKVIKLQKGKRITKEKTLFPGYIYIEADLSGELPHIIKSVPGVMGFLTAVKGGDPMPLSPMEVNRLLGKIDEMAMQEGNIMNPFKVGDPVKITDGLFKDFDGTIEEISEDNKKLKVMVKMFGRKIPLELNFYQVEKV